ncbi:methyltransferase [Shewanella pneumatophori]|uniref:SAM-dependent methyltransferase n=1 Tax=Shewanella pneumatophori TaxID=314092 RepID=A0A9X1ZBG3_9GAMM|nr:methyltransferase [Shewanella pneumatophori]MCL1139164.1 SAM-dependent methyltransferase [Shewanella pneumatophori]
MTAEQKLKQIDTLLTQSQMLWRCRSFECQDLPWQQDFPVLAELVWQLDDDVLDKIDACQYTLNKTLLPALIADLTAQAKDWPIALLEQSAIGNVTPVETEVLSTPQLLDEIDEAHFSAHIKGRKWQQINAFVAKLPVDKTPVLEWCAGKGHLGRLIAKAHHREVVSLEWQQSLCETGEMFATKWQLPQRFICADAFAGQSEQLQTKQLAVALHACGDLHVQLLKHACHAGTQQVVISPCCYHLIQDKQYQPLSAVTKASELTLHRADLQLPLQQSVIANEKHKALRLQEMAWRLGYDALQREVRQTDSYLPVPALKQSQLNGEFSDFCKWAAAAKDVNLADDINWQYYCELGEQRQRLTRRIDLVAHLFRTTLEQWLLLDRVCYLEEHGYQVSLSEFCANSITPRNALITAFK